MRKGVETIREGREDGSCTNSRERERDGKRLVVSKYDNNYNCKLSCMGRNICPSSFNNLIMTSVITTNLIET